MQRAPAKSAAGAERGGSVEGRSAAGARTREKRPRIPVTEVSLAEALLSYLDRFEGSRQKLAQHLAKWVRNRGEPPDPVRARPLIDAVLARYQAAGVVDDQKLAERSVGRLRSRGGSKRAIAFKLRVKGLGSEVVDQAFEREREGTKNAELEAARALVRRRRLGEYRPEAERADQRRRDLGVLARAGFSFETSQAALGGGRDDEF
jgi:regulatory protein